MSRTPIPAHLVHDPGEVEEDGRLFDEFANLIPQEEIIVEPIWAEKISLLSKFRFFGYVIFAGILRAYEEGGYREVVRRLKRPTSEEKIKQNEEYINQQQRETVGLIASALIEEIRQKVEKDGEFRLPFGLVVTKTGDPLPILKV